MESLEIIFCSVLFFFLFSLRHQTAAAGANCGSSSCSGSGPSIRFPFRLSDHQPPSCGYSRHFDLLCNNIQRQATLTLPSSGGFTVESIDYGEQTVWINDLHRCMHKRFLDNTFSLEDSPFHFWHGLENYTYFKCSSGVGAIWSFKPIPCLSGLDYNIIAVPASWSTTEKPPPRSLCNATFTALLPSASFSSEELYGVKLTWVVPDCSSCEDTGRFCGLNATTKQIGGINVTTSQIECSRSIRGLPKAAKYGITLGVPAVILCIIGLVIYLAATRRNRDRLQETDRRGRHQELITQQSIVANGQPRVAIAGLDGPTIESYLKTQLGEDLGLPDTDDKTCSICLGEYKPREFLRTIPECHHYFHAICIDAWLIKNPTCPLCRNISTPVITPAG